MTFLSPRNWLKPLQRQSRVCRRFARRPSRIQRPIRLRLEQLEDRLTPTVFVPTVFNDVSGTGSGSLRQAVIDANNDAGTGTDTIQLSAGTYTLSRVNDGNNHEANSDQGDLNINNATHALVIQGATDANGNPTTIIQQTVADRVFQILNLANGTVAGPTVTFKNLVIEGGKAQDDGGQGAVAGQSDALGGGILNGGGDANLGTFEGGNVTLSNVVVQSNSAKAGNQQSAQGGGIFSLDGALTINHSVIRNNSAIDGGGDATYGGGISFTLPTNTTPLLTITNSTVANNQVSVQAANGVNPNSGSGGGIAAQGTSTIVNSTIANNSATSQGGGVFFQGGATGLLLNDTVSGNQANEGGGLDNNNGDVQTVTLENTIVAGNTITNNTGVPNQDITAQFTSGGHNLIGIGNTFVNNGGGPGDLAGTLANPLNPNLGPLQNNGGTTPTMALLPGSPAIGAGDTTVLGITGPNDQRGPASRARARVLSISAPSSSRSR